VYAALAYHGQVEGSQKMGLACTILATDQDTTTALEWAKIERVLTVEWPEIFECQ
jgi:hypothetical protein